MSQDVLGKPPSFFSDDPIDDTMQDGQVADFDKSIRKRGNEEVEFTHLPQRIVCTESRESNQAATFLPARLGAVENI